MGMTNALNLLCGLALFLYGMHVMGEGLTRASGGRLEGILESLTKSKIKAVLLGAGVTAVIQSSSATTVMVVGFVNSGIMRLSQAAGVIMGANIGTTITSWILSLTGLQGDSLLLTLCKPATFTPVLAFIGVCLLLFAKGDKKHDAGSIMIGFAVLMTGMEMMSSAVKPLANVPEFTNLLLMFTNPILGVIAGALLTAIIQSSSAAVRDGRGEIQRGAADHHGSEHRHLRDGADFFRRREQERQARGADSPVFQHHRHGAVHGRVLRHQRGVPVCVYG